MITFLADFISLVLLFSPHYSMSFDCLEIQNHFKFLSIAKMFLNSKDLKKRVVRSFFANFTDEKHKNSQHKSSFSSSFYTIV